MEHMKFIVLLVVLIGCVSCRRIQRTIHDDDNNQSEQPTTNSNNIDLIEVPNSTELSQISDNYCQKIVQLFIDNDAKVNATDKNGNTALHIAAANGAIDVADILVKAKANLNIQNNNGETPLKLAKTSDHEAMYEEMLLNNGKKLESDQVYDDRNALDIAVDNGNIDRVQRLLKIIDVNSKNDISYTDLEQAFESRDNQWYRDIALREEFDRQLNYLGKTALHVAASSSNTQIANILIENGANVNAVDTQSTDTPLLIAVNGGNIKMVELLIGKGANVSLSSKYGTTPLHAASKNGNIEIAELLIQNGANVNAIDNYGETPLYLAYNKILMVKLLISKGANTNISNKSGRTPLWDAVYRSGNDGNTQVAKFLIENGADVNVVDDTGDTFLHMAIKGYAGKEIAKLLIEKGSNMSIVNDDGQTPLHFAVWADRDHRNEEIIKLLIKNCAPINAKTTTDEKTPLHYAVQTSNQSYEPYLVDLLLENGADPELKDKDEKTPLDLLNSNHSHDDEVASNIRLMLTQGRKKTTLCLQN